MRRILVCSVVLAIAGGLVLSRPSTAAPGGGVMAGSMTYELGESGMYDFTYSFNFDLTGTLGVAQTSYTGTFNVAGKTDRMMVRNRGGYPYRFTGTFPVSGASPMGDSVSGTCGLSGSLWFADDNLLELACIGAVNGAPSGPFTLSIRSVRLPSLPENPPSYTSAHVGVFTSASPAV